MEESQQVDITLHQIEELASVPPLPFPAHIVRTGEPAFPSFISQGDAQASDVEKRMAWRQWAGQQPDSRLLTTEYLFAQLWVSSQGKLYSEEIILVLEEQVKEAERLRVEGFGQIIDKYWVYLTTLRDK